jgi:hypothetical protein
MSTLPITIMVAEDGGDTLQPITNMRAKTDGLELRLTDWSGWDDGPDVRANPVDVPGGDGAYDDDPLFAGRTVIVKGVALADTVTAMQAARAAFRKILAREGYRRGAVTVQVGDDPAEKCSVRLGGATQFKLTQWNRAEWSLSLYAAIPNRLAAEEQTGSTQPYVPSAGLAFPWTFPLSFGGLGTAGQIVAVNGGDIAAGVKLDIADACLNPQIVLVETGQRIAFQTELGTGSGLTIDTDTAKRSVLRDGTAPWGFTMTSDSDLFLLRPGTNTLLFLVDSGTPTLTASWSDARP